MTADELEEWLKGESSTGSGWSKDDGAGETVGHKSGRKIIGILGRKPDRDPAKYVPETSSHTGGEPGQREA